MRVLSSGSAPQSGSHRDHWTCRKDEQDEQKHLQKTGRLQRGPKTKGETEKTAGDQWGLWNIVPKVMNYLSGWDILSPPISFWGPVSNEWVEVQRRRGSGYHLPVSFLW